MDCVRATRQAATLAAVTLACVLASACAPPAPDLRQTYNKQLDDLAHEADCVSLVDPYYSQEYRAAARQRLSEASFGCPDPKVSAEWYSKKIETHTYNRKVLAGRNSRNVSVSVDGETKDCTLSGSDVYC